MYLRHGISANFHSGALLVGVLMSCIVLAGGECFGQCALSCPTAINLSLAGPAQSCRSIVGPQTLGLQTATCPDRYDVDRLSTNGNAMPGDTSATGERVAIFTAADLGRMVRLRVRLRSSGQSCVTQVNVLDGVAPQINVADTMLSVLQLSAAGQGAMDATALDCSPVQLQHTDSIATYRCAGSTNSNGERRYESIFRKWTATDPYNNSSVAQQRIDRIAIDIQQIAPPNDTILSCDYGAIAAVSFGTPVLSFGESLIALPRLEGALANLFWNYTDETFQSSGNQSITLRTWRLFDDCLPASTGNNPRTITQRIRKADTLAPVLTAAFDTLYYNVGSQQCVADVLLPRLGVSDNCSANVSVSVQLAGTQISTNGGLIANVGLGKYAARYRAIDEAGNVAQRLVPVVVRDQSAPVLITNAHKQVALTSTGDATITAQIFDAGSYENCGDLAFGIRRSGDTTWRTSVMLTCADTVGDVALQILATDDAGNANQQQVSASVRDFLPPSLVVPGDVVARCDVDYSDLSVFGTPLVRDNCGATLETNSTIQIDSCGQGTITRVWVARDATNNSAQAQQLIRLRYESGFSESDVTWPQNATAQYCGTPPLPADLPQNISRPTVSSVGCERLNVGYQDRVFGASGAACQTLERTWTVINSCEFDGGGAGEWTYQQYIQLIDTVAPVWSRMDTLWSRSQYICDPVQIKLSDFAAQGCGVDDVLSYQVLITDESTAQQFYEGSTLDTLLSLPAGGYSLQLEVRDVCNNTSVQQVDLQVSDQRAAVAICHDTLVIALNLDQRAYISDGLINAGSHDGCGNSISAWPINDTLDCTSLGATLSTELLVFGHNGVASRCTTQVIVLDTIGICPPKIAQYVGRVTDLQGYPVSTSFDLIGQFGDTITTYHSDGAGNYDFGVVLADSGTITPSSTQDPLYGITGFDLYLIGQHILRRQPLPNLGSLIAADANGSGSITAFDLTHLRRLILSLDTLLPGASTYVYAHDSLELGMTGDLRAFSRYRHYPKLSHADTLRMQVLKLGDVSAARNLAGFGLSSRSRSTLSLKADYGSEGRLQLSISKPLLIYGVTLSFADTSSLRLSPKLADAAMWGSSASGRVMCNVHIDEPIELASGEFLLSLKQADLMIDSDQIVGTVVASDASREVEDRSNQVREFGVRYAPRVVDRDFVNGGDPRVSPNPVRAGNVLRVRSEGIELDKLELYDAQGRRILDYQLIAGGQLTLPESLVGGVYHIRLRYTDGSWTNQRLMVE